MIVLKNFKKTFSAKVNNTMDMAGVVKSDERLRDLLRSEVMQNINSVLNTEFMSECIEKPKKCPSRRKN